MHLYLVRPARAERRSDWSGPGGTRPLTDEGRAQAQGLADWLSRFPIAKLACGPSLHCRETLAPLADALGIPVQVDDRLDRDADLHEMAERVRELGEEDAVICLNRPLLQEALRAVVGAGKNDLETRCERGGAWLIDGEPPRATYFAPHRASLDRGAPIRLDQTLQLSTAGKAAGKHPRVAVLDMGSTSFHLLVAEWTPKGEIRRVARERVMLRMGSELARASTISPGLLDRSIEAVGDLCEFARKNKADELIAVATAALRQADNGPRVLRALEAALGGPIRLLSGAEEARVVYRAIRSRIDLGKQTHLGIDLGGGSLEIIVGRGKEILFETTLPIGVARMHGGIAPEDPHSKSDLRKLRKLVREQIEPHVESISELAPESCVVVGGTARSLGRLILRERGAGSDDLRGLRIDRQDLARVGAEMARETLEERLERPGVGSRRADLLPFGAEILTTLLSLLGFPSLTVCDWGLREGVLLDLRDFQES